MCEENNRHEQIATDVVIHESEKRHCKEGDSHACGHDLDVPVFNCAIIVEDITLFVRDSTLHPKQRIKDGGVKHDPDTSHR
jgi:hypothetical protein